MNTTPRQLVIATAFTVVATMTASAQWLNYPAPGVPRLPNGKVDLAAKAPRTTDRHPSLSGVWHVYSEPLEEKQRLFGADVAGFSVIGDQVTDISKYATDLLIDF